LTHDLYAAILQLGNNLNRLLQMAENSGVF
jgi:hypothetical protein